MSFNLNWDVDKYREEYECEEHWLLRKAFIERWKNNYPEERLICLARVFSNIEFLGCRYPTEVMKEVASLSQEVAKSYRNQKKHKLQRTFVSASDAAEDRAKGIKREAGIVIDIPHVKSKRINFVKQGDTVMEPEENDSDDVVDPDDVAIAMKESLEKNKSQNGRLTVEPSDVAMPTNEEKPKESTPGLVNPYDYLNDLQSLNSVEVRLFKDSMFNTSFGRLVLLIRPWLSRLDNIAASCHACHIKLATEYKSKMYSLSIQGKLLAQGHGDTKPEARKVTETTAWNTIKTQVVSVLIKEQFIAHNNATVNVSDVLGRTQRQDDSFGTPIEGGVASKMMKMMGWKGGGLGVDSQGIAEPIKPCLQLVNRAGLGSSTSDLRHLKLLAGTLMRRYMRSASLDVDLVFSSDFSKEERAALHLVAQKVGLVSKSYGVNADRFLVVKKKLNAFAIVKAAVEEGGNTAKYQVFIPVALNKDGR